MYKFQKRRLITVLLFLLVATLFFTSFPILDAKATNSIRFSLREHKIYAAYNPDVSFTKQTATILRMTSTQAALGAGYIFVTAPRTWLHGKYIRFSWEGYMSTATTSALQVRVIDGSYDRSSDTDFPSGAYCPPKGAGLLQTVVSKVTTFSAETVNVQIDVDGGTEEICTIIFEMYDGNNGRNYWLQIDWFEVNDGSGNLFSEHFTDSVHMERTGGYGDYGYISTGLLSPVYLTTYFNAGGKFLVNSVYYSNGSVNSYNNNSVISLGGAPNSMAYLFKSFNWTTSNTTTNYYNYTLISNMTIWCYFSYSNTTYYYNLGYSVGYSAGYSVGYGAGYAVGYNAGYLSGNSSGFILGNSTGYALGYSVGYALGYSVGYIDGYTAGSPVDYTLEYVSFAFSILILVCGVLSIWAPFLGIGGVIIGLTRIPFLDTDPLLRNLFIVSLFLCTALMIMSIWNRKSKNSV